MINMSLLAKVSNYNYYLKNNKIDEDDIDFNDDIYDIESMKKSSKYTLDYLTARQNKINTLLHNQNKINDQKTGGAKLPIVSHFEVKKPKTKTKTKTKNKKQKNKKTKNK